MTQIKTVTSIRKEAGGYSVAINVGYPVEFKDYTNTSTLEIRPLSATLGGQKNKCLLIGSFGIMPGDWKSRIVVLPVRSTNSQSRVELLFSRNSMRLRLLLHEKKVKSSEQST